MKVVTAAEMATLEKRAYKNGCSEEEFMEEAGKAIALAIEQFVFENNRSRDVAVLCGKGNNGGDGFVAARFLQQMNFSVHVIHLYPIKDCSELCQKNYQCYIDEGGSVFHYKNSEDLVLPQDGVILDGIFGTGFHGAINEPIASFIKMINSSGIPIIAIDIPSGVNGNTGQVEGEAIQAHTTVYLEMPKSGFFLENGWNYVGKLKHAEFGLPSEYIDKAKASFIMSERETLQSLLPPVIRNRHKYQVGLVVGLAGSPGMPGAAMLSSLATFRGGAGIVRLLHPDGMQAELSPSPYELIRIPFNEGDKEKVLTELNKAAATFIGPGIGRDPATRKLLKQILPHIEKPCVVDGDGLTLAAEENIPFPQTAILTPHHGEMQKLLKMADNPSLTENFLQKCSDFAQKNSVTLILKGAPSFIFHPGKITQVNPTGDPGMATAGSGDALTGLLAALLAQGLEPHSAAILGVYLHGLAGEIAVEARGTHYGLMASDIINHFEVAFHSLHE